MSRARSSLPVPDSPRKSTVESVGAAASTMEMTFIQAGLVPRGRSSAATVPRR